MHFVLINLLIRIKIFNFNTFNDKYNIIFMKEATPISSPNASTRSSPSPENDSLVFNFLSPNQQLATRKKVLN